MAIMGRQGEGMEADRSEELRRLDELDWAGLESEVEQLGFVEESVTTKLTGYFRDCAISNQRSLKLFNVFEDKDAQVLSVPVDAWDAAVGDGIQIEGRNAVSIALTNQGNPLEKPLMLGTLFVVGRYRRANGRMATACSPLLLGSVSQTPQATSATFMLESDVSLNLSVLAELSGVDQENEEEVQLRFENLMALVPDAPFDEKELAVFSAALNTQLDLPFTVSAFSGFVEIDLAEHVAASNDLHVVPASAIFIGRDAAELSVIRELEVIAQMEAEETALFSLIEPEQNADSSPSHLGEKGAGISHVRPDDWHDDIEVIELTETQREIIASARVEPMTVVTGPPGTGKSYTIAAVVMDHLLASKTVLVTSGTEKAVNVVADRLRATGGPYIVALSGNRSHQRELAKHIEEVSGPSGAPKRFSTKQIEAERATYSLLRTQLQELEGRLEETLVREGALAFHLQSLEEGRALSERFELGSVDTEVLDSLRDRIHVEPDANWWRRRQALRALNKLRTNIGAKEDCSVDELVSAVDLAHHQSELVDIEAAISADPHLLAGWGKLAELRSGLLTQGTKVLQMQRSTALANLLADDASRRALRKFSQALKAASHKAKRELLKEVPAEVLLNAFPCWVSTDVYLSHVLPLRPGLFDLTIVDEASQVNLSSSTPAMFRGTRAMVVGDPMQLRFVNFLSAAAENAALARHAVPTSYQVTHRFSRRSLFDVADDSVPQRATFILDEHFRSQPHIIGFSNEEFYRRTMRIMTQRPHSEGARAIEVREVGGRRASPAKRNDAEVQVAMEIVGEIVAEASSGGPIRTIGLLSPFRDQANALGIAVTAKYPEAVVKHKITHGTAHSLQGDERDVVIFSAVIDPDFVPGTLRFLEDPNLFNVAVTRASQRLILLTSVTREQLPSSPTNYLSKFLAHAEHPADPSRLPDDFGSGFEREVAEELRHRGLSVISQYPSCGFKLDLVVSNGENSVAVECDGHPDHFNADGSYSIDDVNRHVILYRAGWTIFRLPMSSWKASPETRINEIERTLLNPPARAVPMQPDLPKPVRVAPSQGTSAGSQTKKQARKPQKKATAKSYRAPTGQLPVTSSRCACGGKWVARSGRYGRFYGCSRYPRCRKTRSAR